MSRELNCTWRCENPKHKLTVRRNKSPYNIPICPICRKEMVQHRNATKYFINRNGLSRRRVKRNLLTFKDIVEKYGD